MAFETNNFNVAKKVALPKNQLNVECNVACSDEISKVLSISGEACLSGQEVLSGTVNYSAYIDLCIVYINNDGEIGKVNSTCPFSSKFNSEQIQNGQKATILLKTLDCTIDGISADNIRATCTLEEKCLLVDNQEIKSIRCEDDDVQTKQEKIIVNKFLGEAEEKINVKSELNIRDSIKRVILTESQVLVKNVESGNNFVSISGDLIVRVLYLTENDKFESNYVYESFKEELELEGANKESKVEGRAQVLRDSVKVTLDQEEKGSKILLEVPISLNVKAYTSVEAEVIQDLYSTKNELGITTSSFEMTCVCTTTMLEGKIDGSLTLDEDKPRVDKIMFVGGNSVSITNTYVKDEEIYLEGIAKSNVIYLNDEENMLNSVLLEVPFVITDKFANEECEGDISVDAVVCDVDVVVKKGRELFYDAKIKANVNFCHDQVSGVISDVMVTEELPQMDCNMQLIYAHAGQGLWDIAKQARVKEDVLQAQNPDVIFPLSEDQGLILFYQKFN